MVVRASAQPKHDCLYCSPLSERHETPCTAPSSLNGETAIAVSLVERKRRTFSLVERKLSTIFSSREKTSYAFLHVRENVVRFSPRKRKSSTVFYSFEKWKTKNRARGCALGVLGRRARNEAL
jgi:hypothetical protein